MNKAVFLDRDGTINEDIHYLCKTADFRLLPGAAQAIRRLKENGWLIVIITNQSGIARGYCTKADVDAVHAHMRAELAAAGAAPDAIYYCPHAPDAGCACRKPGAQLFEQAARALHIDLPASIMVGDKLTDLLAAPRLGCRTSLVLTGCGRDEASHIPAGPFQPDHIAEDLWECAQWIIQSSTIDPAK